MVHSGYPQKQAVAAALSTARKSGKSKHSKFQKRAGHNPPKPEYGEAAEGPPAKTYPIADWQRKHLREEAQSLERAVRKGSDTGLAAQRMEQAKQLRRESESRVPLPEPRPIPGAGHNPPKPTHAYPAGIPRHLRGRGLISAKAMEAAGHKQAKRSHRAPGPQVARAGKSHAAHGDAGAAKPWHGKKYTAKGKPPKGPENAAGAHHD